MVYKKSNRRNKRNYLSKNRSPKRKTLKRRNGIRNIQVAKRRSNKRKRSNKININSSKKRMRGGANLPMSPDYEAWEAVADKMSELSRLHMIGSGKFQMYDEFARLARGARIGTVEYNENNLRAFKRILEIYTETMPHLPMPSVITFKGNRRMFVSSEAREAERDRIAADAASAAITAQGSNYDPTSFGRGAFSGPTVSGH